MNNKWIFQNGIALDQTFTSFPYAFREMYNIVRKELERGKLLVDITKRMKIVSPLKTIHGDLKTYSYTAAMDLAKGYGLLTPDGTLNSKEFKRKIS